MTDFTTLTKNLEERGFSVRTFATAAEAADYLDRKSVIISYYDPDAKRSITDLASAYCAK